MTLIGRVYLFFLRFLCPVLGAEGEGCDLASSGDCPAEDEGEVFSVEVEVEGVGSGSPTEMPTETRFLCGVPGELIGDFLGDSSVITLGES